MKYGPVFIHGGFYDQVYDECAVTRVTIKPLGSTAWRDKEGTPAGQL
jgi:hypothetical protein